MTEEETAAVVEDPVARTKEETPMDPKEQEDPKAQESTETKTKASPWPHTQPLPRIPIWIKDWTATFIIGCFVVSHWRGLWTLFDLWTCDQPTSATLISGENFCFGAFYAVDPEIGQKRLDSGIFTYILGVVFTVVGVFLVWMGFWTPPADKEVTIWRGFMRFLIILILGFAAVCQWRGIWYVTDHLIWIDKPVQSFWLTTGVGYGGTLLLCSSAALLAPPFVFLIDGPSRYQPPIAVTIVSSFYSLALPASEMPPPRSPASLLLDSLVSFFGLPILVVWFWRGLWLLEDQYFWGFTTEWNDLYISLVYGSILSLGCAVFGSEPIVYFFPGQEKIKFGRIVTPIFGRFRTLILAIGNVSFWRVVWSLWDLGPGTTYASAWSSEVVSVFLLTVLGCVSCIVAPPATLGVDVTPHPKCHDEPLFSMLPIPWELLYIFGIARQPEDVITPLPSMTTHSTPAPEQDEENPPRTSLKASIRSGATSLKDSIRSSLSDSAYFERQRPDLEHRFCSETLSQRPSSANVRHRSQFHRSR